MKTKKYYLILAVLTAISSVPALAKVELPLPSDKPVLIGNPIQGLVRIKEFHVNIVRPGSEPNKDGLVWAELDKKMRHKLKEAGLNVKAMSPFPRPELRIDTDMLKLRDAQKYVFRIQTSLQRIVTLPMQRKIHIAADVWRAKSPMQVVSVQNMPAKVTSVVLEQVETLIHAYLAANPPGTQPPDANYITVKPEKLTKPDEKRIVAEYKYVASKNSKVFHKPDCRWAKRIKPENLVGYNSRDEAIEAGKRPCKMCKP